MRRDATNVVSIYRLLPSHISGEVLYAKCLLLYCLPPEK